MTAAHLPIYISFVVKLLVLLGLFVYGVFAGVMVRQEHLMSDVLEEAFEPVLRFLVLAHFFASLALFLLALVVL